MSYEVSTSQNVFFAIFGNLESPRGNEENFRAPARLGVIFGATEANVRRSENSMKKSFDLGPFAT